MEDSPPSKRLRAETPSTPENAGRQRGTWWCMECQHPAFSACMESHDVSRPNVALRRGVDRLKDDVEDVMCVWDQLDPDNDHPSRHKEQNVLTALRMLRSAPTTCKLTVLQDGFEDVSVEWRLDNLKDESYPERRARLLLKPAVVALAARGQLKPEPVEGEETSTKGATQSALTTELDLSRLGITPDSNMPYAHHPQLAGILRHVRDHGLRRLTKLYCTPSSNCAWALKLLQNAAPTLEDLELLEPLEEHICTFTLMPRLRRLAIVDADDPDWDWKRPEMTALPPLPHPSPLLSLRLDFMPDSTVRALLQTFGSSLEELKLMFCEGLLPILEECRLPRLSKLLLTPYIKHNPVDCAPQVAALRRVLPRIKVRCCSRGCPQQGGADKSGNT